MKISEAIDPSIWERVNKTETCWLWTGPKWNSGYGTVYVSGERIVAHRVFYELLVGPVPDHLDLDHLCRVKNCVNPAHLEPVTGRENTLRGIGPSALNAKKTHCIKGHPLSGCNLRIDTKGGRACKACNAIAAKECRERRKANHGK